MNLLWIMLRASIYMLNEKLFMLSAEKYTRSRTWNDAAAAITTTAIVEAVRNEECIPPHGLAHIVQRYQPKML